MAVQMVALCFVVRSDGNCLLRMHFVSCWVCTSCEAAPSGGGTESCRAASRQAFEMVVARARLVVLTAGSLLLGGGWGDWWGGHPRMRLNVLLCSDPDSRLLKAVGLG
eukprot:2066386-Amphidinium_carterae.1